MSGIKSFDMYEDKKPPKWPHNGIPFNRWNLKLHAFLYALQFGGFYWGKHPKFSKVKYLNIRVDTRNGNFIVFSEGDEVISPDELGLEYKPVKVEVVEDDSDIKTQD